MTYCVGLMLNRGLVFMSDTRTNAGLDNVSTFRKMTLWENPGHSVITMMSAGNLATTQAVVSLLQERVKSPEERTPALLDISSLFQSVRLIAETLREVIEQHTEGGLQAESPFHATLLVGGQVKGSVPRLFLVYPEGNFIEATPDTPFFQIGETKYGRPILIRGFDPAMSFEDAMKLLLVSFDSTLKANLSVGAPFDYHFYSTDSLTLGRCGRIAPDDPYFTSVSEHWGEKLKDALDSLPKYQFE